MQDFVHQPYECSGVGFRAVLAASLSTCESGRQEANMEGLGRVSLFCGSPYNLTMLQCYNTRKRISVVLLFVFIL